MYNMSAQHDATITPEQAKSAALKANPVHIPNLGDRYRCRTWEREHGYRSTTSNSNGMEVVVDVSTGVVLYAEVDSDGEGEDWGLEWLEGLKHQKPIFFDNMVNILCHNFYIGKNYFLSLNFFLIVVNSMIVLMFYGWTIGYLKNNCITS